MTRRLPNRRIHAAMSCLLSLLVPCGAVAQSATAVPKLDLDKLTGTWYQIAKLPVKAEKKCLSDGTVLYALNDKNKSFQTGTFCTIKGGEQDDITNSGKQDKQGTGKLKVRHLVIFSRKYWVLATDPNFEWALVGSPNHKSLWILSRKPEIAPELYQQLQTTAAAQGFPVAKLVPVSHPKDRVTIASPSANPSQIETPSPTPTQTSPTQTSPTQPASN